VFKRTPKPARRHEERIAELTDAVVELERDMRIHKLELLEMYDKIHRLFGRIAKRAAIDNPPLPEPTLLPSTTEPVIDDISAAILARRSKGKVA